MRIFLWALIMSIIILICGCSGNSPITNQLQIVDGIQIVFPDQDSTLVSGQVEEIIWTVNSKKLIKYYKVFLCGETEENIFGTTERKWGLVLYHGIIPIGLDGDYTIRVEAYGFGRQGMLMSATSEPFTVISSLQGDGVEVDFYYPEPESIYYTNGFYIGAYGHIFDGEKCPVSGFSANFYLSGEDNQWYYIPDMSALSPYNWAGGLLGSSMNLPSNLSGEYQIRADIWTFGTYMIATNVTETFSVERRNTGILSIIEPNQETVWDLSGTGIVSGYLVDENDIPVTGDMVIEAVIYGSDPTIFYYRDGVELTRYVEKEFYCDDGQFSFILEDFSRIDRRSGIPQQLYVYKRNTTGLLTSG